MIIQIKLKDLCFAIEADEEKIIAAAPVAKWCVGHNLSKVLLYYKGRGATYEKIVNN